MPTWLITGCSTGLGRHLAEAVLQRGYNAVVTARNAGTLGDLARSCPETCLALSLDVTDQTQVTGAVKQAEDRFGGVDVLPAFFSDAVFELAHDADSTRRAVFDLAAIAAGVVRSFALPDVSTELAGLSGAQTFDGDKTFAGALEASGPVATIGTATSTATYGVGTGATASGVNGGGKTRHRAAQ